MTATAAAIITTTTKELGLLRGPLSRRRSKFLRKGCAPFPIYLAPLPLTRFPFRALLPLFHLGFGALRVVRAPNLGRFFVVVAFVFLNCGLRPFCG